MKHRPYVPPVHPDYESGWQDGFDAGMVAMFGVLCAGLLVIAGVALTFWAMGP